MRLRLPVEVQPGTVVAFQLDDGTSLCGVVRYSRELSEHEHNIWIAVADARRSLERRKEVRSKCKGAAVLAVSNDSGCCARHAAAIFDASQSGLGCYSSEPLPIGLVIDLSLRDVQISGIVRNCMPGPLGFRIGMNVASIQKIEPAQAPASRMERFAARVVAVGHSAAILALSAHEAWLALADKSAHCRFRTALLQGIEQLETCESRPQGWKRAAAVRPALDPRQLYKPY